jgi:NADPH2:quinone reductase
MVLPEAELVSVSLGLDPADAVSLVLNYTTAYQMLRIANVQKGDRVLIHVAAGGVGTAALELGRLAGLEMFGTASRGKHELVPHVGRQADRLQERGLCLGRSAGHWLWS